MRFLMLTITLLGFTAIPALANDQDSVFERIKKNNTIKCGYAEWPSFFDIDANTGDFSGFFYDFWDIVGEELSLKIDWTTPVQWGQVTEAISSKKIDLFCNAVWPDAGRRKHLLLSDPIFYTPLYVYVRSEDEKFLNKDLSDLNNGNYTSSALDGDSSESHLKRYFPKAKRHMLTASSPYSDLILSVITGKSDFVISDEPEANSFIKNNPNKIRKISEKPITIKMVQIPLKKNEHHLLNVLNGVIQDLTNDGTIEKLIKKHKIQGVIIGKKSTQ